MLVASCLAPHSDSGSDFVKGKWIVDCVSRARVRPGYGCGPSGRRAVNWMKPAIETSDDARFTGCGSCFSGKWLTLAAVSIPMPVCPRPRRCELAMFEPAIKRPFFATNCVVHVCTWRRGGTDLACALRQSLGQ